MQKKKNNYFLKLFLVYVPIPKFSSVLSRWWVVASRYNTSVSRTRVQKNSFRVSALNRTVLHIVLYNIIWWRFHTRRTVNCVITTDSDDQTRTVIL